MAFGIGGLLPGDLELSFVEDAQSTAGAETRNDSPLVRSRGMRSSAALVQAVRDAATIYDADLALMGSTRLARRMDERDRSIRRHRKPTGRPG